MEALQACAASDDGKQTVANVGAISSGGAPIFREKIEQVSLPLGVLGRNR